MYIGDYGKALKVKGPVKTTDLFKKCWEQLSGMEELSGALEKVYWAIPPSEKADVVLPQQWEEIRVNVTPGGNEGALAEFSLYLGEGKPDLFLGRVKTLGDGPRDFMDLGGIAGAFSYLANVFMWVNT